MLAEWEAAGRTSDEVAWQAPLHVHHTDDGVVRGVRHALLAELHGGFSGDVAALFERYGCSLLG